MYKVLYCKLRNIYLIPSGAVVDEFGNSAGSWVARPTNTPGEYTYTITRGSLRDKIAADTLELLSVPEVPKWVHSRMCLDGHGEATQTSQTSSPPTNPKQLYGDKKVPLGLVPASFMAHTATALLEGALKYGAWNFRAAPVEAMTYAHAAMRHIEKWVNGEECDPLSKVHHLGNAAACMAILLDTLAQGTLIDNRPPAQDLDKLFTQLEGTVAHLRELHKDAKPTNYTNGTTGTAATT